MKIGDVVKITGLTSKAIRLYEEKGLLRVPRTENTYRDYDEASVAVLQEIKQFRDIGIPLEEIKLYVHGVITAEEMLGKRRERIEKENRTNEWQYLECLRLMKGVQTRDALSYSEDDTEKGEFRTSDAEVLLGINIDVYFVSIVVADLHQKTVVETYSLDTHSELPSEEGFSEHDTEALWQQIEKTVTFLAQCYPKIRAIGVTGQAHGFVYVDADGMAVSPLYTWRDKRADRLMEDSLTYCERMEQISGIPISTGYAFATHYYNQQNGLVPKAAKTFCSIMDYVTMRLTGKREPLIHTTNAADFGMYLLTEKSFDCSALEKLGLTDLALPEVTDEMAIVGTWMGIPVAVAFGDVQSGVFGTLRDEKSSILVNFSVGSQVLAVTDHLPDKALSDIRPYFGGRYLLCGASLCGGRAYAMLETFFRTYAMEAGFQGNSQYDVLNRLAKKAYASHSDLKVSTLFCGTRAHPFLRGSIRNISDTNFTPENLTLGILQGMADELADLYEPFRDPHIHQMVAAGRAARSTPVLQALLADTFGMKLSLSATGGEVALGTALLAGIACNCIEEKNAKEFIHFKGEKNETTEME